MAKTRRNKPQAKAPAHAITFRQENLTLPCLISAWAFAQRSVGWPPELGSEVRLRAQLVYDFAHAVHHVWSANLNHVASAFVKLRNEKERALIAKHGSTAEHALLQGIHGIETQIAECFEKIVSASSYAAEIARAVALAGARHPGVDTSHADTALRNVLSMESETIRDALEKQTIMETDMARLIGIYSKLTCSRNHRDAESLKKRFQSEYADSLRERKDIFFISPAALASSSLYAYRLDAHWIARATEKLSEIVAGKRFSLPSYSFRRQIRNITDHICAVVPTLCSRTTTPFSHWIDQHGFLYGISHKNTFDDLSTACRRQDETLDRLFRSFGFESFASYRKSHEPDHHRMCERLGIPSLLPS